MCVRCGRNPLVTATMCQMCIDGHKDLMKQVRKDRRAAGMCPICGKNPPEPGKTRCGDCGPKANASTARMVAARKQAGHCVRCGYDGPLKTSRQCQSCADAANLAANARSHGLTVAQYQELLVQGCRICGSMDGVQIDHDHSCCDRVAAGRSRSGSCGKCIRGTLCGFHNTLTANLENLDAVAVLEYLLATRSGSLLVKYVNGLTRKGGAAE